MLKREKYCALNMKSDIAARNWPIGNVATAPGVEILERAEKTGISWPIDLSDKQLVSLLHPPVG